MSFRDRLVASLRALAPVLAVEPQPSMPDPVRHRHLVAALLERLEEAADRDD